MSLILKNYYICPEHGYEWRENMDCISCFSTAMNDPRGWGYAITEMDTIRYNKLTSEEKEQLKEEEKKEDEEREVKAYTSTAKIRTVNTRTGVLKTKWLYPCKYHCHKSEPGKITPGGSGWAEGCQLQSDNACPYIHIDELGWDEAVEIYKQHDIKNGIKLDKLIELNLGLNVVAYEEGRIERGKFVEEKKQHHKKHHHRKPTNNNSTGWE